jgi:hypothetical protein
MQEAANKGKDGGRCPVCGRVSIVEAYFSKYVVFEMLSQELVHSCLHCNI